MLWDKDDVAQEQVSVQTSHWCSAACPRYNLYLCSPSFWAFHPGLNFKAGQSEHLGQTPRERKLAMTAKPAGPLCVFVCLISSVYLFLLKDRLYGCFPLALHLSSTIMSWTFLSQLPLSQSLSLFCVFCKADPHHHLTKPSCLWTTSKNSQNHFLVFFFFSPLNVGAFVFWSHLCFVFPSCVSVCVCLHQVVWEQLHRVCTENTPPKKNTNQSPHQSWDMYIQVHGRQKTLRC